MGRVDSCRNDDSGDVTFNCRRLTVSSEEVVDDTKHEVVVSGNWSRRSLHDVTKTFVRSYVNHSIRA